MTDLTGSVAASSRIWDAAIPGLADASPLPDAGLFNERAPVVLPAGVKEGLLRTVAAGARLRRAVPVPGVAAAVARSSAADRPGSVGKAGGASAWSVPTGERITYAKAS